MNIQLEIQVFVGSAKYMVLVDRSNIQAVGQQQKLNSIRNTQPHTDDVDIE